MWRLWLENIQSSRFQWKTEVDRKVVFLVSFVYLISGLTKYVRYFSNKINIITIKFVGNDLHCVRSVWSC